MTTDTTQHHWIGCKPNPAKFFGFIYVITDLTAGKFYVGKKQYWSSRRKVGCKSKVTDRQSSKWKPCCWSCSDWRYYKGSSKHLEEWMEEHPDHEYEFRIIKQCRSRGTLHYSEVEALVRTGSLWQADEDNEHLFFNRQIAATRFRPSLFYGEEPWLVTLEDIAKQ